MIMGSTLMGMEFLIFDNIFYDFIVFVAVALRQSKAGVVALG